MSLKAFHIVFIIVSTLVAVAFGAWAIRDFATSGSGLNLALGVASLVGSLALVRYGVWFLRKMKNVGYL
ncbi:MAG: hypothetical protein VX466_09455 [Myxococcota bacterium]|nr:hypothetical protein [Myxococcota bacterium]